MRRFGILVASLVMLPLTILSSACERAHTISVNPSEIQLSKVGATMDIKAEPRDRRGAKTDAPITFRSRDPHVAEVSSSGTVTAVGDGTTTVEIVVEGTDVMEFVRVVVRLPDRIELRPAATTCYIGGLKNLTAKVLDRNGKEIRPVTITWHSSDETKARVDDSGEVTGIDQGLATITAKAMGLEAQSKITVAWAPGQKQLLEMEERAKRGGRRGGGGGGRRDTGEGGGGDPRLSLFE